MKRQKASAINVFDGIVYLAICLDAVPIVAIINGVLVGASGYSVWCNQGQTPLNLVLTGVFIVVIGCTAYVWLKYATFVYAVRKETAEKSTSRK